MENIGYLDRDYWESSMKMADVRKMNIIAVDWQRSGLCARRLVWSQGVFRTAPMLADGEYIHKRNGRSPEAFFCGKLDDYFEAIRPLSILEREKKSLLLISVPECRLERCQSLKFAGKLERTAEALAGATAVILFPRIRTVWEYCRGIWQRESGVGVIQISEEETQFLLRSGQEISVSFGDRLAADGASRQYYNKPVRYRENNYLYEADRFLWQEASYASWYQAFGQICGKVFAAQEWEQEHCCLALTGSECGLPCAKKALADMEAAADGGLYRANEIPVYLLWWFCRVHGLAWGEPLFVSENGRKDRDGRKDDGCGRTEQTGEYERSGRYGQAGRNRENIWDI